MPISNEQFYLLLVGVVIIAFLYSSVGHAGASGYIAVMSLFGLAPGFIKPSALLLNILVAGIGSWQFWRAGHFSWALFWPFALLAIPCAFLGGYLDLPTHFFKILVGIVLLFSSALFFFHPRDERIIGPPSPAVAVPVGTGLGLLAGLTGTGGGIFLTPLILLMRWGDAKRAAAVSSVFILTNSISALLGNFTSTGQFPVLAIALAIVAIAGGSIGSYFGSRRFPNTTIERLLAVVLVIAGVKLIFTR